MITIAITYKGENGQALAFAKEMEASGTAELIRQQDGNISYQYFIPLDDSDSILLLDQWENQEALDSHHASPMMSKIMALREHYGLRMSAERFVTDEAGFTDHDKSFMN